MKIILGHCIRMLTNYVGCGTALVLAHLVNVTFGVYVACPRGQERSSIPVSRSESRTRGQCGAAVENGFVRLRSRAILLTSQCVGRNDKQVSARPGSAAAFRDARMKA
eukprot:4637758-Pleurochrysis_carterae.AAC.3